MPEQVQKLQHFVDNVLKEAEEESRALQRQMERRRKAALHTARLSAWDSAKTYYDQQAAAMRAEAGGELSRHLLEGQRQIYLRRAEITREVIAEVRRRLVAFLSSPEYPVCLKKTLHEVMGQLDGVDEITLRLRHDDLPLGPMLAESVAPVKVTVEESRIKIGGLNVRCPKLGIRVDCSFDAQLEEMSGHFAEIFGLSLSDSDE